MDAVIDAGYGDAGKGHIVSQLAGPYDMVVKCNGGPQAGHTVRIGMEDRIYSQMGAASHKGADTLLTQDFMIDPVSFWNEHYDFCNKHFDAAEKDKNDNPATVFFSEYCPVITPYDIAINQMLEKSRGDNRHGSVGLGINETKVRHCDKQEFPFHAGEFFWDKHIDPEISSIARKIWNIQEKWVPKRLEELGLNKDDFPFLKKVIESSEVMEQFINACLYMRTHAMTVPAQLDTAQFCQIAEHNGHHIVFECGQGLQLDKDYGEFPYVTPSNTGLTNVRKYVDDDRNLNAYYITRSYTVRHGPGPLPFEETLPFASTCETNETNQFQGHLRYSPLNVDMLADGIHHDIECTGVDRGLIVTCMDEFPEEGEVIVDGMKLRIHKKELLGILSREIGFSEVWYTDGPKSRIKEGEIFPYY